MNFAPMPPSALITAMLSAMQAFILEVSGNTAKKLSAGSFVFHIEIIGKVALVLATSSENRPEELKELRSSFLHKYGSNLASFKGEVDVFYPFEDDVNQILGLEYKEEKVLPSKQLNSFALLQIKSDLQQVAREIVMKKEIKIKELAGILDQTQLITRMQLEELFDLGFIGKYLDGKEFVYFL
jgi:hypothetical protein